MPVPGLVPRLSAALVLISAGCATRGPAHMPDGPEAREVLVDVLEDLRSEVGTDGLVPEPGAAARARRRLEESLWRRPSHAPTWTAAGALQLQAGDREAAKRSLDRALDLEPLDADAALLRARLALEGGSVVVAARLLDGAIRLTPGDRDLYELRAGVAYAAGDLDAAEQHLDSCELLTDDDPQRARLAYHRGLVAEARGEREAALAAFRRAVELDPALEPARVRLGWLERLPGDR